MILYKLFEHSTAEIKLEAIKQQISDLEWKIRFCRNDMDGILDNLEYRARLIELLDVKETLEAEIKEAKKQN